MSDDELDALLKKRPAEDARDGSAHVDDGHLLAYRAGTLDSEQTAEVERHLSSCSACRKLLTLLVEPVPVEFATWASDAWPQPTPAASVVRLSTWRKAGFGVGGLAAAAAVLLLALPKPPDLDTARYVLEPLRGGRARTRAVATSTAIPEYGPGSLVRAVLRPTRPLEDDAVPELSITVSREGAAPVPVHPFRVERHPSGTMSIEIEADKVRQGPGVHELLFRIGSRDGMSANPAPTLKASLRFDAFPGGPDEPI